MSRFMKSLHAVLTLGAIVPMALSTALLAAPTKNPNDEMKRIRQMYQLNSMAPRALWDSLSNLETQVQTLDENNRLNWSLIRADILLKANYPVAAAVIAADMIKAAKDPLDNNLKGAWHLLNRTSRSGQVQFILEDLALTVKLKALPPFFNADWNYQLANAYAAQGQDQNAVTYYRKIVMGDRYFMPAQYQLAMIYLAADKEKEAEIALKSILYKNTRDASELSQTDKIELWNYANMALGRLYYQQRQFLDSARHYRKVTKTSPLFYDALFEQSWALFMSGHPQHALGSLYSASSPYFKDTYNPEAKLLEAIVYYWMCRYDDSRGSVATFASQYASAVEGLSSFLDRKQLSSESAYQLFENLVSGVSSETLGIPRAVLNKVATSDTMLLIREQLAGMMDEDERLNANGVNGSKNGLDRIHLSLEQNSKALRKNLGDQFIVELKSERVRYEELYDQSQFLYIELLMSEKEKILGSELHSSTKVTHVPSKDIRGWSRDNQSWKFGLGQEYWWDELGYYVVNAEPLCKN